MEALHAEVLSPRQEVVPPFSFTYFPEATFYVLHILIHFLIAVRVYTGNGVAVVHSAGSSSLYHRRVTSCAALGLGLPAQPYLSLPNQRLAIRLESKPSVSCLVDSIQATWIPLQQVP